MDISIMNIAEEFGHIGELNTNNIIARMNEFLFKIVRLQCGYDWHSHPETDEVFFVFGGELSIDLRDKTLVLRKGDMVSIPAGVEHKPYSTGECLLMFVEPASNVNLSDTVDAAAVEEWI